MTVSWAGFEEGRFSSDRDRAEGTPDRRTSISSRPGWGGSQPVEGTAFNSLGRQVGTRRALIGKLVLEASKPEFEHLKSPACDRRLPGLSSPPPAPCPRKLRDSVWNYWRLEPGRQAQASFHVGSSGPLFPGETSDGVSKPQPQQDPRRPRGQWSARVRSPTAATQLSASSCPWQGAGSGVQGCCRSWRAWKGRGAAAEGGKHPASLMENVLALVISGPRSPLERGLFGANDPTGPRPGRWLPHLESPGPS